MAVDDVAVHICRALSAGPYLVLSLENPLFLRLFRLRFEHQLHQFCRLLVQRVAHVGGQHGVRAIHLAVAPHAELKSCLSYDLLKR